MDIKDLLSQNRNGKAIGLPSFCTANVHVVEAIVEFAASNNLPVLIEATCNQVNQNGGYSGMTPADYAIWVKQVANTAGLKNENLLLGGDHLGPNPWRKLPAAEAMTRAEELVAAYVEAGFKKIHLDASMTCAGELSLSFEEVARRAAHLCRVAEETASDPAKLFYVIGTEVPIPGGETGNMDNIKVTEIRHLHETISTHFEAFQAQGLEQAFKRVICVVIQPGVDFSHTEIIPYRSQASRELAQTIIENYKFSFEAHSTDYQTTKALSELVADHNLFLKVGPELTFAFREAVLNLEQIELSMIKTNRSNLLNTVKKVMEKDKRDWQSYYHGSAEEQEFLKIYSYSDRIRYYWDHPEVKASLERLLTNLDAIPIPVGLVSQHFGIPSYEYTGESSRQLIKDTINKSVKRYYTACGYHLPSES